MTRAGASLSTTMAATRVRGSNFALLSKINADGRYQCATCSYDTKQSYNFTVHLASEKHRTMCELQKWTRERSCGGQPSCENDADGDGEEGPSLACVDTPSECDADDDIEETQEMIEEQETREQEEEEEPSVLTRPESEWFPFATQTELLFYIFLNSMTHPISDGVALYVHYMLKQLQPDLKPISAFKNMSFGDLNWRNVIKEFKDEDGNLFTFVSPLEMLKMMLANPKTSCEMIRLNEHQVSNVIAEQVDGSRIQEITTNGGYGFVPINIFMDDMSTNRSRRWSPFHVLQMQPATTPLHMRSNQSFVKFVCASERVGVPKMLRALKEEIDEVNMEGGVDAYDAVKGEAVKITTSVSAGIADINQLVECCCHLGPNTNKYCPRCHATSEHFDEKAELRKPDETLNTLDRLSIRQNKTKLQRQTGVKWTNQDKAIWDLINPHEDIPVGTLHWLYLGLVKHVLRLAMDKLDKEGQKRLMAHLQSMDQTSFVCPFTSDITKYLDSRQGKDFKQYLQLAPFNMEFAGLERKYVQMLCKLGEITIFIEKTKRYGEPEYEQLQQMLDEYISQIKQNAPSLGQKLKTHMSVHIIDDIKRHGPPTGMREDAFEKNHGLVRKQLARENQLARSRDTASLFARNEIATHVLDGGFYKDNDEWKSCTVTVTAECKNTAVKNFLGVREAAEPKSGGLLRKLVRDEKKTNSTEFSANAVYAQSDELVNVGNSVLFKNENDEEQIGIFLKGKRTSDGKDRVIIEPLQKRPEEIRLGCEVVEKTGLSILLHPSKILQKMCVLHDCKKAKCAIVERRMKKKVEQKDVLLRREIVKHSDINSYIVNRFRLTHGFRN